MLFSQPSHAAVDTTPPVIEEIYILQPNVKAGGEFKIEVKAFDDISGIENITVIFRSPSGKHSTVGQFNISESNVLNGIFTLEYKLKSDYIERGQWDLFSIYITDKVDNRTYENFSNGELFNGKKYSFNVVDEEVPSPEVNDGFKELPSHSNVALDKEWAIQFSLDLDIKTLLTQNIYVLDKYKNKVPVLFIVDRENNNTTSKIIVAPLDGWKSKSEYTLYIKDVYSKSGSALKENTKMLFTTK